MKPAMGMAIQVDDSAFLPNYTPVPTFIGTGRPLNITKPIFCSIQPLPGCRFFASRRLQTS